MTRFRSSVPVPVKRRRIPANEAPPTGRSMAGYREDFRYLAAHDAEFNKKYEDEWVAILNREVLDHSPDHSELLARLGASGLLAKDPVIAHCPAVPENARF